MKTACFALATLLLAAALFAQEPVDPAFDPPLGQPGGSTDGKIRWNGTIGMVIINGKIYQQFGMRPDIPFGKFGVGLDLTFRFDEEGNFKDDEWNDGTDYVQKLYYLRYGLPGDPLYARVGALDNVTLGYGLIMRRYSNTIQYPEVKRIGAYTEGSHLGVGWQAMLNNVTELDEPGLMAGRLYYDTGFKGITVGATLAHDGNQFAGILDDDKDGVPDRLDLFEDRNDFEVSNVLRSPMTNPFIYLDNAATTRPDPAVIEAMREAMAEQWGNPSSAHEAGSAAKMRLEESRAAIAKAMGCQDDEVFFTSGGTEADNWALLGVLDYWRGKKSHLITASTEHHAIIDAAKWWRERGGEVTILDVDSEGRLDPLAVKQAITAKTAVVSVMHVNNELGTIQDVTEIGRLCREAGVVFHTDCVQSFGKLEFRFHELNADLASISSHKIYGPKGAGALVIRRGTRISPRTIGGNQERGLRPGTENTPGIIGFAKAAQVAMAEMATEMPRIRAMRDRLEREILERIPDVKINGSREHRAPAPLNVSFRGCEGEALLIALDRKGFCVSTGSACSAGALGASHVLIGLGMDPLTAQASLRFSFGRFNTMIDVDALMEILPGVVERQRQLAPAAFRV